MDTMSAKDYLDDLLFAFRLRCLTYEELQNDLSAIDYGLRQKLYKNYDYERLFKEMTALLTPDSPIEFVDSFGLSYTVYQYSQEKTSICVIGPYLYDRPKFSKDSPELISFLERLGISRDQAENILGYFSRITLVMDDLAWHRVLDRFLIRNHLNPSDSWIEVHEQSPSRNIPLAVQSAKSELAYEAFEERYALEHKMLEAITAGNAPLALNYHNLLMGHSFEARSSDNMRNSRNYMIAANTAFRKAVEAACVHPLYIDRLSGQFIREIENASGEVALHNINTIMIRKYCMLVNTYSRAKNSSIIRECLNYIDFNYKERLSLSFFAAKHSVSKNYLSCLFHEEVGLTITDYINQTRLRHAIFCLNTTGMSMQEISEECGFSDANYFTRTFKKKYGQSPLKYRKSLSQPYPA